MKLKQTNSISFPFMELQNKSFCAPKSGNGPKFSRTGPGPLQGPKFTILPQSTFRPGPSFTVLLRSVSSTLRCPHTGPQWAPTSMPLFWSSLMAIKRQGKYKLRIRSSTFGRRLPFHPSSSKFTLLPLRIFRLIFSVTPFLSHDSDDCSAPSAFFDLKIYPFLTSFFGMDIINI